MPSPLVQPESLPKNLADLANADPALVLFDCRFRLGQPEAGRGAYDEGHIPGARYADLERDLSGLVVACQTGRHPLPEPEQLARKLRAWGVSERSRVVVYDDQAGALAAARLWWLLRWLGHSKVAVLDGGYPAWLAGGGEPTTVEPETVPGDFVPRPRHDLTLTADQVATLVRQPGARVFDARALERYRGDVEPIDAVPGHIPGAHPLPFTDHLDEGRFRPPAEVAARFAAALGPTSIGDAAVYCGSGVTACHLILAAEHAGLAPPRLYPGSYSEWITDPSRPVARGG
ncbi:MAG TPA: sulfurtransferase [Polyangiaceae bacterium]|nr:sulfurtransferase [Polyangiaceae bacterium]